MDVKMLITGSGASVVPAVASPRAEVPVVDPVPVAVDAVPSAAKAIEPLVNVEVALKGLQSAGLYFENTQSDGVPSWVVLTALRSYGLNLKAAKPAQEVPAERAVVAQAAAEVEPAPVKPLPKVEAKAAPVEAEPVKVTFA